MKSLITRSALTLSLVFGLSVALFAHGGIYTGPLGHGSTGGFAPSGVGTPGPGPSPAGGSTGSGNPGTTAPIGHGTAGPGSPTGIPPSPGGKPGAGTPGPGTVPGTTGAVKAKSRENPLYGWDAWWFFNDKRFLNLKAKLRSEANETSNIDLGLGGAYLFGDDVAKVNARLIREQINPVLKYALKDPFFDTRAAALIALAKTGMPEALADISALTADDHKIVRETTFLAMGILGNKEAIPTLIAVMSDMPEARKMVGQSRGIDARSRAFAALAIGLIGARDSDLSDTDAVSALLAMIKDKDNSRHLDLQVAPIVALGLMQAKDALPNLVSFLDDRSNPAWVRAYAATSIAKLGDRAGLAALVKGLADKHNSVVQSCALGLGRLAEAGDKDAVDKLQSLTRDGDLGVANFAMMSLAEIGGIENRNLLVRLTRSGPSGPRSFATLGLGVYMFKNFGDTDRIEVAEQILKTFKSEKNLDIRGASAIALGLMNYDPAGSVILEAVVDGVPASLRGHLCSALGLLRHSAAIPEIRRAVSDKGDIDLRRTAAVALGLMGDPEAVNFLQKEIAASENSMAVQGAVTQGLGYIGDRRAVPTLVKFLRDRDDYQDVTRAFAAVALGLLGDKDDLPVISLISEFNNYLIRTDAIGEVLTIL